MALVDIQVIEGVYSDAEKALMIEKVTDAVVGIGGEMLRGVTWVRVHDVRDSQWGIGGQPLTAEDVRALKDTR